VHGTGPTRAHTNIHHSRNLQYGEGHPGEGDIRGNKRTPTKQTNWSHRRIGPKIGDASPMIRMPSGRRLISPPAVLARQSRGSKARPVRRPDLRMPWARQSSPHPA
jgi:hypothetical protein